jgi:hypothetical protein
MRAHIRAAHPSYITPGWPALGGVHTAVLTEGQHLLSSREMATTLDYGEGEERRLGLAESFEKWAFTKDPKIKVEPNTKREEQSDLELSNAHDLVLPQKHVRLI